MTWKDELYLEDYSDIDKENARRIRLAKRQMAAAHLSMVFSVELTRALIGGNKLHPGQYVTTELDLLEYGRYRLILEPIR